MGNRAVITTEAKELGVYLHWNGGRDSVEAFLLFCKLKGYRCPEYDNYGWARLCQVIGNFFGGELSVGIDKYENLDTDNGDNGVYIIKNWEIIGREFYSGDEQNSTQITEMMGAINGSQPKGEQLSDEIITEAISARSGITTKQIRAIHTILGALKWTDYRYRKLLTALFNVTTCKELTEKQASILIDILNKMEEQSNG